MKYFTPELWARLQDVSDAVVWSAAHQEWGSAIQDARESLAAISSQIPPRLREFREREA